MIVDTMHDAYRPGSAEPDRPAAGASRNMSFTTGSENEVESVLLVFSIYEGRTKWQPTRLATNN